MSTTETKIQKPSSVRHDGDGVNVSVPERVVSGIAGGVLAAYGARRKDLPGAGMAVAGAALVGRAITGHCPVSASMGRNSADEPRYNLKIESVCTIDKTPEELYSYWRKLENLPGVMSHLQSVTDLGGGRSHWVASAPAGRSVEWEATIINDVPNELIAWQSVEGSDIDNGGTVRFQPAPGNRGTELRVTLEYNPPGGALGAMVARMFGEEPKQQIAADLRRFKEMVEVGEAPTTKGQPTGKSPRGQESDLVAALHPSR